MTQHMKIFRRIIFLALLSSLWMIFEGCPHNEGAYLPNARPIARLSNVPPQSDTVVTTSPQFTLYWVGDDPDGYVVGFRYRWTINNLQEPGVWEDYRILLNIMVQKYALMAVTKDPTAVPAVYKYFATLPPTGLDTASISHLKRGDSITVAGVKVYASNSDSILIPGTTQRDSNRFPFHVNPTSGTFIFESPDSVNLHTFAIEAIDNLGATSAVPAEVSFETPSAEAPDTKIDILPDTSLVILHKNDAFTGLEFDYHSVDPNSSYNTYQWAVDREFYAPDSVPWSTFQPYQTVKIAAESFHDPYATSHTFSVRAKNLFGVIDPTPAETTFYTFYPSFARPGYLQRILLINNSLDSASLGPQSPTRAMIESFYENILNDLGKSGKFDVWESGSAPPIGIGFPGASTLQAYSFVILVADRGNATGGMEPLLDPGRESGLIQYCNTGGNAMFIGWGIRSSTAIQVTDAFYRNLIHVDQSSVFHVGIANLLIRIPATEIIMGAQGQLGYPDIVWDSTKLYPSWSGGIPGQLLTFPTGFGETIYKTLDSNTGSPYHLESIGVRYIGPGFFNSIFLPFPLYFAQQPVAEQFMRKAFTDVGELNRP
ncbi:MAG TPA: hypothetical protein VLY03_00205 [Bacteroidota bacterium]|nr:hypothetical protein [Bacteroidota bacterium]